ncbi:MAG: hypothetical protein J7K21_05445 [Desulfurococcales archaeon]|nr:hypothetical protein [Desulfurococcales archaeon]
MFKKKERNNAVNVKLYLVKTKDTWLSRDCSLDIDRKVIVCGKEEYPLLSTAKIINEDKYVQIMIGNTKAVEINETGDYSTIDDPSAIEESVAKGLSRALERPSIWWQWLMLLMFGFLGGLGFGALLGLWLLPKPEIPPIHVFVNTTGGVPIMPMPGG